MTLAVAGFGLSHLEQFGCSSQLAKVLELEEVLALWEPKWVSEWVVDSPSWGIPVGTLVHLTAFYHLLLETDSQLAS